MRGVSTKGMTKDVVEVDGGEGDNKDDAAESDAKSSELTKKAAKDKSKNKKRKKPAPS